MHLAIIGPDEGIGSRLAARARALPNSVRVSFVDTVSGAEREQVLAAADVFALTSRSEGLPNAALEALAAGIPCLLTDACHIPEVARAEAGFVVPVAVDAIAVALRTLVSDPALRARQGANGRRLAAGSFALDIVVERLEQVLSDAAAKARRCRRTDQGSTGPDGAA